MTESLCRILHTSDIHLDNRVAEQGGHSAAQSGLIKVIDKALELEVDLFLLAGDLFDHNRVKTHCTDFAREQLGRLSCPVVMISGNHDCMNEQSVYHRFDPRDAGDHVYFISEIQGGVVDLPMLGVSIWGRGIVDHHPDHKPLGFVPERAQDDGWYIGITHGYYVDRGAQMYSSLITPEEIERCQLDYLALGHVHVFSEMTHGQTRAAYSGSPNKDQGVKEETAAYVELIPDHGAQISRVVL